MCGRLTSTSTARSLEQQALPVKPEMVQEEVEVGVVPEEGIQTKDQGKARRRRWRMLRSTRTTSTACLSSSRRHAAEWRRRSQSLVPSRRMSHLLLAALVRATTMSQSTSCSISRPRRSRKPTIFNPIRSRASRTLVPPSPPPGNHSALQSGLPQLDRLVLMVQSILIVATLVALVPLISLVTPLVLVVVQTNRLLVLLAFFATGNRTAPVSGRPLRQALRGLNTMEVFSLFLSTMGKVDQFTPAQDHDQSTRINFGVIKSIPPYTDLGYDHLMKENPFDPDSMLLLGEAVKDGYMANHGRPLLGTQYQHGSDDVKKGIIAFAKMKLLNENIVAIYSEKEDCKLKSLDTLLTSQQKFACLSQRLALQFHSINYILPEEREQVESHMRICLEVDERSKTMKSTSGSEPLLAEAAAELMQDFDPVTALVPVLSGFSIHVGDRGDLVASAILLLHRDAMVRKAIEHGKGKEEARVVPLLDYLTALFPTAREDILKARPSGGKVPTSKKFTLKDDLQGACFHFNHQFEVHDDGVVKRVYMVRFHSRSAMIICGNCQSGIVDLMFAFCASSPKLSINNTGLVLVQVTLDSRDTHEPDWSLHDLMDPARLQLFDGEEPEDHKTPVPIIRIVFAFGAKTAAVHVRPQPPAAERAKDARFRTYDIWCSGMSSRTLGPVNNISSWEALLARVDIWHSIYSTSKVGQDGRQLVSPMKSNLRKQQMMGAAEMPAFFSQWVEDKRGLCPDKPPKTERSTRSRPQK
ncbi:uncharacterized protein LAESUDRAFT_471830 [Laetiporus sulphureus 93-53]|uniref:Uncharacterized protein n=1 Tax=Laetiporus sulphureus 93-53 TaxID=1314785 RepID=A0A165GAT1_9APHY|nr:uncharacterized protein LAESUDRAFT_471830 [Laetiporus sulphureus 93-53]KZT10084.1 hypothetical protein LAESUDRAFT_471830 [Laetiporus sulphureus 93-53]